MSELRLILDESVARPMVESVLCTHGYVRERLYARGHHRQRVALWRRGDVELQVVEDHVLGERFVVTGAPIPAELATQLGRVTRDAIVAEADPLTARGLVALRRLALLEHDEPSPALLELIARGLRDPDIVVRRAMLSIVTYGVPVLKPWLLETARAHESDPYMLEFYARVAATLRGATS